VSATLNVAVRVPETVGLNTTVMMQLAEAARLDPHVLVEMLKSPGFAPPIAMLLIVIVALPVFFSVAVCDALEDPTFTLP